MTQEQAQSLIAQIQTETRYVSMEVKRVHKGKSGFAVVATLLQKRIQHTLLKKDEWLSIKQSWQWWLPDVEAVEEDKHEYYLIDGIPMKILLCSDGYWRGYYYANEQRCRKYFGKDDPRGKYPAWEGEQAS